MIIDRRKFLARASSLAILVASPASARPRGIVGIVPFNNGRSQINMNFPLNDPALAFINIAKTLQDWTYRSAPNANATVDPGTRDADGYPTTIQAGGYYSVTTIPTQAERLGNVVIKWDGTGTIIAPTGTMVSSAPGRYVYTPTQQGVTIGWSAINASPNHVHNVRICYADEEALLDAGEIFSPKFIATLREMNCGVIRFLNWQDGNVTNVTTWATRRPVTYFQYCSDEWRNAANVNGPALYAGVTTNSGDDYAITFGSGGPIDKQTIQLAFNANETAAPATVTISNASPCVVSWTGHGFSGNEPIELATTNTLNLPLSPAQNVYVKSVVDPDHFSISLTPGGAAINTTSNGAGTQTGIRAPTLNLNSSGAIPIRNQWGVAVDGTTIKAGRYNTLVYDADFASWLLFNGSSGTGVGLGNWVPIEICLALCIKLGAHPYFVSPFLACDPMTDWHTQLATYLKVNAPSWMIPRIETVNEAWNSGGGFYGTRYGWNKAFLHWGASYFDINNWVGKIASTIGQAFGAVYGVSPPNVQGNTKYQMLCGVHMSDGDGPSVANDRLLSTAYAAQAASPQVGYTKDPAYQWCSHITTALYITPSEYGTPQEVSDAYAYSIGNPTQQAALASSYCDTLNSGSTTGVISRANTRYVNLFAWAQGTTTPPNSGNKWGGAYQLKMTGYEGGYNINVLQSSVTSPVSGATQANPCVVTLATTSNQGIGQGQTTSNNPTPAAAVGMSLSFASVGGMTQLNGNTYTVSATNVGGDPTKVAINVDATGFSAYTSGGTATYVGAANNMAALRYAGKSPSQMQTYTALNYTNFVNAGGEFPSQFDLCGTHVASGLGDLWALFDPDLYAAPSPGYAAIVAFNH